MTRLVVRRLAWTAIVVWFVVSATFAVTFLLPADPARAMLGPHADPATVLRLRHKMCLDRPFFGQYACFVGKLVRGDLGHSFQTGESIARLLAQRAGPTAMLALGAIGMQVMVGVSLGVYATVGRRRSAQLVSSVVTWLAQGAPTFVVGSLLMYFLAYRLDLFPVSGYGEPGWDRLWHLCLPAMTLMGSGMAVYARVMKVELSDALSEDYARTARAKGLSEAQVTTRHALRNALLPVVTMVGMDLGVLMGGAVVTEFLFQWPGLGREAVLGILNLDLPVVLGVVLVSSVAVAVMNLLVDLAYVFLDPRVRVE
ncbi:MAG: ABC transporter permease [Deltaproteobacteria bacterium]|nr:ABC transporter permease [Deltaproteobacteria bacterium]